MANKTGIDPIHSNQIMMNNVLIKDYEYIAAGKPVISTKIHWVMRELGDNNGITYLDESEGTIDKALALLARKVIDKKGLKARKFVENCVWDTITREYEKVLGGLL